MGALRTITVGLVTLAVTSCDFSPAPKGQLLVVRAPERIRQSLFGEALCSQLTAELTFDRTDDLAPPPIDAVRLSPKAGAVCRWVLDEEAQLRPGQYDLMVRFRTEVPPGRCSDRILVGMYVKRDITFPFATEFEGLTDLDFLSRPSDENDPRLNGESVSFNEDGDERDNLSEMSVDADPCHVNSVPVVTIEGVPPGDVLEGWPMQLTVRSEDADDVAHRIQLSIRHQNGAQFSPETLVFSSFTNSDATASIQPDPTSRGWNEEWDLVPGVDVDSRPGAGLWVIDVIADEPFVGSLIIQAIADDGDQNVLDGTSPVSVSIVQDPLADLPMALLEGGNQPVTVLAFEEQASPAIEHRFTVVDLNLGSPSSSFSTELQPAAFPAGLTLSHDGGTSVLSWSPTNTQAVSTSSFSATLDLYDGTHTKQGEVVIDMLVAPLLNDAPTIIPPRPQFLALPGQSFSSAVVPFFIDDIDLVTVQPVCEVVSVAPSGSTSCTMPFSAVNCDVTSTMPVRSQWPASMTLAPGANYASCGSNPTFTATIRVTDDPPPGATNGALTDQIQVDLRTAEAMVPALVTDGPAAGPTGIPDPHAVFIDGSVKRALIAHWQAISLVDLANPAQGYLKDFTATNEACVTDTFQPSYSEGAVDEQNHRVALLGRFLPGTSCDVGFLIFDLMGETVAAQDLTSACGGFVGGSGDVTNPVVDPVTGNFYVLCDSTTTRVVEFAAGGQQTVKTITGFNPPFVQEVNAAVVTDPVGISFLVFVSNDGLFVIDLSTFDNSTPVTMNITAPRTREMDERIVDTERSTYLYIYEESANAYLGRLDIDSTQMPFAQLRTPLLLGTTKWDVDRGLVLRRPFSGMPTPPPHLVASLGEDIPSEYYDVVRVDLDQWTIHGTPESTSDYDFGSRSHRFWPTADRRYFLQTAYNYSPLGFWLHPWDGSQSEFFAHPDLGSKVWVAEASHDANLAVVSADKLIVLDFPEAALNLDQ